jgi:hypothetical protein
LHAMQCLHWLGRAAIPQWTSLIIRRGRSSDPDRATAGEHRSRHQTRCRWRRSRATSACNPTIETFIAGRAQLRNLQGGAPDVMKAPCSGGNSSKLFVVLLACGRSPLTRTAYLRP